MSELGDRILLLIVAATGVSVLIAGWAGGLVEAEAGGWTELALFGFLGFLVFVLLVGLWRGFGEIG
ncbi:hypothetical protein [Salinilacihabitans rarus]|uniref:hypothetical protein n=1 Tax=Salinilacihabitans rarus TaxID=2961596 RepID=UPI0020C93333|nr:hypothetical protein [Salinilacihabitans rarus]